MRFLVIGLGSMGKRRVRNLQALGFEHIAGFDTRPDRCIEAQEKYGIATYGNFSEAIEDYDPNTFVISTSPEYHMFYANKAFERGISCFIEASVVDAEAILALHEKCKDTAILMAPSCTMRYFPGPKKVKELISEGAIGKVLNINYQTGQYLPDWHPWEKIEEFYVSNRDTGGAREIVPFELTWLNDIFGTPIPLACVKAKLTDMNTDIDDIYHCILKYSDSILANVTVEVISRPKATRDLRVLGSEGEIVFSADENCVRYANQETLDWVRFEFGEGTVEKDYINPEEPYISEMKDFTDAVIKGDKSIYPNNLLDDYSILQTLYSLEKISEGV